MLERIEKNIETTPRYCAALHYISPTHCCAVLHHCTAPMHCRAVLYYTALHSCTVLHCIVFHYTLLHLCTTLSTMSIHSNDQRVHSVEIIHSNYTIVYLYYPITRCMQPPYLNLSYLFLSHLTSCHCILYNCSTWVCVKRETDHPHTENSSKNSSMPATINTAEKYSCRWVGALQPSLLSSLLVSFLLVSLFS